MKSVETLLDEARLIILTGEQIKVSELSGNKITVSYKFTDVADQEYALLIALLYDRIETDSAYISDGYSWRTAFMRALRATVSDLIAIVKQKTRYTTLEIEPINESKKSVLPDGEQLSTPYSLLSLAVHLSEKGDLKRAASILRIIISDPNSTLFLKKVSGVRLSKILLDLNREKLSQRALYYFTKGV